MLAVPLRMPTWSPPGTASGTFEDFLAHDAADPYWAPLHHRDLGRGGTCGSARSPDGTTFSLRGQLRADFQVLRKTAGGPPG